MMATFAVTGTLLAEWPVNLAFAEITGLVVKALYEPPYEPVCEPLADTMAR